MWQWFVLLGAIGLFAWSLRAKHLVDPRVFRPPECGWYFGSLFPVLRTTDRHHAWKASWLKEAVVRGAEMCELSMWGNPKTYIEVTSPRMVEHLLKTDFNAFVKGPTFHRLMLEVLGDGIFNSDGQAWREQRKVASHMFTKRSLNEHMLDVFTRHAATVVKKVEAVRPFEIIDLQEIFLRYTFDSICEIAFGLHTDTLASDQPHPFSIAFDDAQEITSRRLLVPPFVWKTKCALGVGSEARLTAAVRVINDFIANIIKERRRNMHAFEQNGDLLSLFLHDAHSRGEDLSDTYLRDIILSFMIAGRDTTAVGLSWLFYQLSERPDIEAKVVDELYEQIGESGAVDEENLRECRYLEAAFLETLRLYPPVPADLKVAAKESTFPNGVRVPPETVIAYSPYAFGRLSTFWGDDAESFRVDRWLDDDGRVRQPSQFVFPVFNAGPRLCLGKSMAILEAKVLAATILPRFVLRTAPNATVEWKMTIVLKLRDGLKMTVRPRENAV